MTLGEFNTQFDKLTKPQDRLEFLLARLTNHNDVLLERVARFLGYFDDLRSVAALKQLTYHHDSPQVQHADERYISVSGAAQESLERLRPNPDLKRLAAATTAAEMDSLIRALLRRANTHTDEVCAVLSAKAKTQPAIVVPLFMKYFLGHAEEVAVQYPAISLPLLGSHFRTTENSSTTATAVRIARRIKAYQYIPLLVPRLAADADEISSFDDSGVIFELKVMLAAYGDKSLPFLEGFLYSDNAFARTTAIFILSDIHTPASLNLLRELQRDVQTRMTTLGRRQNTPLNRNKDYQKLAEFMESIRDALKLSAQGTKQKV